MKKMTAPTLVRNVKKFPRRPRFTFAGITGMFLDHQHEDDLRRPPAEQISLELANRNVGATEGGAV